MTLDAEHGRRFGGLERLYGAGARQVLHGSRVAVVGVGGVGSWAVEALARSGVGQLTLIDFDNVALSNVNRQIQALDSTLGEAKVRALQERIHDINPLCRVQAVEEFLTPENMSSLLPEHDGVIDACDDARVKAALMVYARRNKMNLVVCGAAGGKRDPLRLRQNDLARVTHDALLARVRSLVRKEYRLAARKNGTFGVPCIYLAEPAVRGNACTAGDLSCAGYGSSVAVTASMGMAAAAWCVERLLVRQSD